MSSAAFEVALYAPQMVLVPLAWIPCRIPSVFLV